MSARRRGLNTGRRRWQTRGRALGDFVMSLLLSVAEHVFLLVIYVVRQAVRVVSVAARQVRDWARYCQLERSRRVERPRPRPTPPAGAGPTLGGVRLSAWSTSGLKGRKAEITEYLLMVHTGKLDADSKAIDAAQEDLALIDAEWKRRAGEQQRRGRSRQENRT